MGERGERGEKEDIKYFNMSFQTRSPAGPVTRSLMSVSDESPACPSLWPPSIRLGSRSSSIPAAAAEAAAALPDAKFGYLSWP